MQVCDGETREDTAAMTTREGTSMAPVRYVLQRSAFGALGIVWQGTVEGPRLLRVFLPVPQTPVEALAQAAFVGAQPRSNPSIAELGERMQAFLEGETVDFELGMVALERCSSFQQRVILAEHKIPRGWVSTYGRIASSLGIPGGARAVGRALAENPFPIIIPCHRAIRAGGQLGGYQGGRKLKRALLELEGIEFSLTEKALMRRVYY